MGATVQSATVPPHVELVAGRAHVALRGLVRGYFGYRERMEVPVRRRELPGGRAVLVVGLGPALGVEDSGRAAQRLHSFVGGLHLAPAFTEHDGEMAGVEVELTPLGARALLGIPMSELTGITVDLAELWGTPAVTELAERAATARSWSERFAVVEQAVRRRVERAALPAPELQWAYARLRDRPVGTIARELGWSERRLARAFRDQVGLPPKATARLLRFERAVAALARGSGLAEAAFEAGYADQPHFTREVRELTGTTPARLVAERFQGDALLAPAAAQLAAAAA